MSEKEKQIAKETESIIAQGFYLYNEKKVQLTKQSLYEKIIILDENYLANLNANQAEVTAGKIQGDCRIKVVNMDAFDALRTEHLANALVLNFADPYTPGGNFLSGVCG